MVLDLHVKNISKIFGILVTFNPNIALLARQLESSVHQLDFLCIIDNGSLNSDSICQELTSDDRFSKIELLRLPSNIGLAAAQNIGIMKAKILLVTHVILFDQDSLLESGFIKGLLDCELSLINSKFPVAAVGPTFYDPETGLDYPATVYRGPFIQRTEFKESDFLEATFIIASGCLIRLDILESVGLMCEELFVDYIDVEWSLRAKSQGLAVFITKNARMAHTVGDRRIKIAGRTISVHGPMRRYYLIRNSFMMLRKSYIPTGYKVREVVFNLLRFIIGFYQSKEKKLYLHYSYRGLKDGIKGQFGPYKD